VDRFQELLAECRTHGHVETEVCLDCLPPLSEAVDVYRDDFMAGFGLRDSAAFDDWQFFQSESLRRELAGALERLARGRGALGEWEPAVAHARRWLALDTLHEPAHRLLIQLYAWSDQRAAALRQYRELERLLDQEMGEAPSAATRALLRRIESEPAAGGPAARHETDTRAANAANGARAGRGTGGRGTGRSRGGAGPAARARIAPRRRPAGPR